MASKPICSKAQTTSSADVLVRRRRLPHRESTGCTYFVTFRLTDSLPRTALRDLTTQYEEILGGKKRRYLNLSPEERQKLARLFWGSMEKQLDAGTGACHFLRPEIAGVMAAGLRYFDGQRYKLFAWCVMPNHVHVLFRPFPGQLLERILHSWKSFTANQANRLLGTSGRFWQREYYDHLVRNEKQFLRIVNYIVKNPIKAKLQNWPWVYVAKW